LLLEVAEAFCWVLAGFFGFGFDCVVEGTVLIFCCIGSLDLGWIPQQSVDKNGLPSTFTGVGAGSGFGASQIHKGIPHLHSIRGVAL